MIFVGAPYWDFDKEVIEKRVAAVAKYCGRLIEQGIPVFAPVIFGTKVLEYCSLPNDFDFWKKYSLEMLDHSEMLHVLMIPGWKQSKGLLAEIKHADKFGIRTEFIEV